MVLFSSVSVKYLISLSSLSSKHSMLATLPHLRHDDDEGISRSATHDRWLDKLSRDTRSSSSSSSSTLYAPHL